MADPSVKPMKREPIPQVFRGVGLTAIPSSPTAGYSVNSNWSGRSGPVSLGATGPPRKDSNDKRPARNLPGLKRGR